MYPPLLIKMLCLIYKLYYKLYYSEIDNFSNIGCNVTRTVIVTDFLTCSENPVDCC